MNLEKICFQTIELTKVVGSFIRNEKEKISVEKVEVKGLNDFVTYVDKTSEKKIIDGLKKMVPEAGFIAEEGTETVKGDIMNWIVDPLDGTTNYIHGIYPCAISIALMRNDTIILGVVYEIGLDECFYAWEGSKAYLNNKEISVSNTKTIKDTLVATGFPYYDYSRLKPFINTTEYFIKNTRGLRRLGSAATDLAYLACGRFDIFYEYSLNAWDVAAGAFIVQQAGGLVSDFEGKNNFIFGEEILASNRFIFNNVSEIIKKHMVS